MAVLYKTTDRVKIRIADVTFTVSPLSQKQRMECYKAMESTSGNDVLNLNSLTTKLMQYMIKDVEGIELSNGEKYELEFDNGQLSKGCVDDLFNIELSDKLNKSLQAFLKGVPTEVIDYETDKPLEDVEILSGKNRTK